MSSEVSERRKHRRYDRRNSIGFRLNSSDPTPTLRGLIINISKSGMCLCTFNPIYVDQKITISDPLPMPYRKANAQWVQKKSEDFYKAGFMFIE
jgi:hypothetical protein